MKMVKSSVNTLDANFNVNSAAPETGVQAETEVDAEKPKRPVRVKKASKKAEEQQQALDTYSDDDENNEE